MTHTQRTHVQVERVARVLCICYGLPYIQYIDESVAFTVFNNYKAGYKTAQILRNNIIATRVSSRMGEIACRLPAAGMSGCSPWEIENSFSLKAVVFHIGLLQFFPPYLSTKTVLKYPRKISIVCIDRLTTLALLYADAGALFILSFYCSNACSE